MCAKTFSPTSRQSSPNRLHWNVNLIQCLNPVIIVIFSVQLSVCVTRIDANRDWRLTTVGLRQELTDRRVYRGNALIDCVKYQSNSSSRVNSVLMWNTTNFFADKSYSIKQTIIPLIGRKKFNFRTNCYGKEFFWKFEKSFFMKKIRFAFHSSLKR